MAYETIQLDRDKTLARVTLNRPDVRNAMDATMIDELTRAFVEITKDDTLRVVVLGGEGKLFCAGADIEWMRASVELTDEENRHDAENLSLMLRAIDECPKPVIGRVHGVAFGGALGLIGACDLVASASDAVFSFSEVKLGILPAVISPFVVPKMGMSHARRYFLTAERFTSQQAWAMGLVHEIVAPEQLDDVIEEWVYAFDLCGPNALAEVKSLLRELTPIDRSRVVDLTIDTIARVRTSEEAQEGLRAFLEKRLPEWRTQG